MNEFDREMREYSKRHIDDKDYCVHCAYSNKTKYTNKKKYGNESVFHNKEIKEKIKTTMLERYGCENAFSSEEIQEKIRRVDGAMAQEGMPLTKDIKKKLYNCIIGLPFKL